jgi:uncharacterized protein YwqG
LGQLNLGDIQSVAPLSGWPREGTLAFFHAWPDDVWGFDPLARGHCRTIYCPATEHTKVMPAPADLSDEAKFPERIVSFAPEWTLPTYIDAGEVTLSFWDDDYHDLCAKIMSITAEECPIHRCGGHPQQIQGDMQLECQLVTNGIYCGDPSGYRDPRVPLLTPGAADWQLLLQIDSDEERLGWMWGDLGRLYFWARQQDIAENDFDGSWALLQCG